MTNSEELIWKKTLYIQLFKIYEKELLNIFEHIHPIWENLKTYGNRIHELHLRICSEVENIAKEVCYTIKSKEEVEWIMKDKRLDEIKKWLSWIWCEDEKVVNYIMDKNKFSPFNHYLDFLDEHLAICSKKIEKIYGIENYDIYKFSYKAEFYKPFERAGIWNVPWWWTNYNWIKHRKLETYNLCTLHDLISSFWWYFILLNYLYFWFNEIIPDNWYLVNNVLEYMKWGNYIKSEIFIPTCAFIEYPIRLLANPDEQHIDKNIVSKVDHAVTESTNALHIIKLVNKELDSINEYLYFCCLKLVPTIGIKDLNMKLWSNELYKLKPFICFTNQHIENVTSSKIGINDEEWEINYNLEIWYPSDYWDTHIIVWDDKKSE